MAEDTLTATIAASTEEIPKEVWNALVPNTDGVPDNPFLDHDFFLSLEESGCATPETGWMPQHILLEQNGEPVGLMPLFLKSHSQGEYVFDYGWADAYMRAGGEYYPKLQCSVPFTPASAPKLLVPSGDERLRRALLQTSEQICTRIGASSVHATFVPEDEQKLAEEAEWLVRHDTQFHWFNQEFADFDAFLQTLSSRKRKNIRKERAGALADGIEIKWITGDDLTEAHWDAFFTFYMDTGDRKWGRPYLNREFFSLINERMADRTLLIFAYEDGEPIAGALNFIGEDTLYGRNWGCIKDVPFLHFEVCYYQAIDFAISRGLPKVEAGAQGEHKLSRGYVPTQTRSIHWIAHPGLRDAVADYLEQERRAVASDQSFLSEHTPYRKGNE